MLKHVLKYIAYRKRRPDFHTGFLKRIFSEFRLDMYIRFFFSLIILLSILGMPSLFMVGVSAQVGQGINPSNEEGIMPGSIISRDARTGYFYLARTINSPDVFGIIVEKPLMTIIPDEESNVSVLRTGQARVSVVLLNGPIKTGDYVTTSNVPGYGMLASREHRNIVGIALEDFTETDATDVVVDNLGQEISAGLVLVDLRIGVSDDDELFPAEREEDSLLEQMEHYLAMIARYLAAAMVALGALYFSYHFFKANVKDGLSALGRNPLARQSIQKMMLFNMFLVVLISVGGLLLSALILLIPVFIIRVM